MLETYTQLRDFLDLYTNVRGEIQGDPATIAGEAAAAGYVRKDEQYARQLQDEPLGADPRPDSRAHPEYWTE
jgi:hypothetical protein